MEGQGFALELNGVRTVNYVKEGNWKWTDTFMKFDWKKETCMLK